MRSRPEFAESQVIALKSHLADAETAFEEMASGMSQTEEIFGARVAVEKASHCAKKAHFKRLQRRKR